MTPRWICEALRETRVFSHYAYGDPLPVYAMYFDGEGKSVSIDEAAVVYVNCQREAGHAGKHLARGVAPWED